MWFTKHLDNFKYGLRACTAAEPGRGQVARWFRLALLSFHPRHTRADVRDFRVEEVALRRRLNEIGCVFHAGYMAALRTGGPDSLDPHEYDSWDGDMEGFFAEGAAFGFSLLDCLPLPGADRFSTFVQGAGQKHVYMGYVGYGWALASLPRWLVHSPLDEDSLLGWLAFDGLGFSRGYFQPEQAIRSKEREPNLSGYARRAFDQGLGRSLWFVKGAHSARIASTIKTFDPSRREDLWSGVGLAATYAGGREAADLRRLHSLGDHGWLAQGAAFAVEARHRAGIVTPEVNTACSALIGLAPLDAAHIVRECKPNQMVDSAEDSTPRYEQWRQCVRDHLLG